MKRLKLDVPAAALTAALTAVAALSGALLSGGAARAEVVERIVAIVNNEPILKSEVDEQFFLFAASNRIDVSNAALADSLRREILTRLVEERVILDQAKKKGIEVTEKEVDAGVEQAVQDTRERMGSEEVFQAELAREGLTFDELKEKYRTEVRQSLLVNRILQREVRSKVTITPAEVDSFYAENRDRIPERPDRVQLAHIFIEPKLSPEVLEKTEARAKAALQKLEGGTRFEDLARQVSDDPSGKYGGDLGNPERGSLEPDFEKALEGLPPGGRSGLVRTRYGFHIVERLADPDTAHYAVRHILFRAVPTKADTLAAKERIEGILQEIRAGAPFDSLAKVHSEDPETAPEGGELGLLLSRNMIPEYAEAIEGLEIGGTSPPVWGDGGWHLIKLEGRERGGVPGLDEIRDQLAEAVRQEKMKGEYERWIEEAKREAYIEVKSPEGK